MEKERRSNYPMNEEDMYKLSDIQDFIAKERRHDELDRLKEVKQQKRVWLQVVICCLAINLGYLILSIIGYMNK